MAPAPPRARHAPAGHRRAGRRRAGRPRAGRPRAPYTAAVALVAALALAAPPAPGAAAPRQDDPAPAATRPDPAAAGGGMVPAALRESLSTAADGTADFWVRFADRADLSEARRIPDWNARGAEVVEALREAAESSQAGVRALLAGTDHPPQRYRAFWATNAIFIQGGSLALAEELAARSEVEQLRPPVEYALVAPAAIDDPAPAQVDGVEWGVADIRADQVWDELGVTGEGITVATIDTGVRFDHPALAARYRGNNGDGTFSHDYHWFDAAGECGSAPCDRNGHGTHVTGTIAGDGGDGNRIGVAPGARWIAANGCCPTPDALIASGQWMLAPTDLRGRNPDPSRRPHIVNNSWGTQSPSDDPFMEDVLENWAASGILGVWANGNHGRQGCRSSGAPGSRTINYSVGAYDRNGLIAPFSSRGSGQDGVVKPDLAAPGVGVRSALPFPDRPYGTRSGTSMAAPHLAGAVALLWSAAPALAGNPAETRQLLDATAVDSADSSCGGTPAHNNAWGEGRLDARGLLAAAPVGDAGVLTGRVTDAATGEPVAEATVTLTGPLTRELVTGPDGRYRATLSPGRYQVTTAAFGYHLAADGAGVAAGGTTGHDLDLEPLDHVTVSGTVRDISGHGWPVYARLSVVDTPVSTFSDPVTGEFRLRLPAHHTHQVEVEPRLPGYLRPTVTISVGGGDLTREIRLPVDGERCRAPGYAHEVDGLYQDFDRGAPPEGWTITGSLDNGEVWHFDDPRSRGNRTGGDGGFAMVDSAHYGLGGGGQDTMLVSPVIDLSAVTAPVIRFQQDFQWAASGPPQYGEVELSLDGGATWRTVHRQSGTSVPGPRRDVIAIPQAAGAPHARVRFHYGDALGARWWQLDDILVGDHLRCVPVAGGLVVGHVRDRNTGSGVDGATITAGGATATTFDPRDPDRRAGFYALFSPGSGDAALTATADRYATDRRTADVEASGVVRADLALAAGRITVDPPELDETVPVDGSATRTVTVTNTGTAPVALGVRERRGPYAPAGPGAPARRIDSGATSARQLAGAVTAPPDAPPVAASPSAAAAEPWAALPTLPARIADNRLALVDGELFSFGGRTPTGPVSDMYAYDPATREWSPRTSFPGPPRAQAAVGVIDGLVYLVSGWNGLDRTTLIYDPAADRWRTGADLPTGRAAAGTAVLDGQLYLVGGCLDLGCVTHADDVLRYHPARDEWEAVARYPVPVAWQSCGAVAGRLYCAGGVSGADATTATYAYDPVSDAWQRRRDMPRAHWAAAYHGANDRLLVSGGVTAGLALTNEGLGYDPERDVWEPLPPSHHVLARGGSACGFTKVGGGSTSVAGTSNLAETLPGFLDCDGGAGPPWLAADPATTVLAPGASLTVTVDLRAEVEEPGTYRAALALRDDTPYRAVDPVEVTLTVPPPAGWGRLTGTVRGIDCHGDARPLPGATVSLAGRPGPAATLRSGTGGGYARWLPVAGAPTTLVVARPGYVPQTRQVRVRPGTTTVVDVMLAARCGPG